MTGTKKPLVDHDNVEWPSIAAAARGYGFADSTLQRRISEGRPVNEALCIKENYNKNLVTDHLGMVFGNITQMCRYWSVNKNTYMSRRRRGYSVKQALTEENHAGLNHKHRKRREPEKRYMEEWEVALLCRKWAK